MAAARTVLFGVLAVLAAAPAAKAERLVTSLSNYRVLITSNFTGADLVLFGSVERDAATVARRGGYDVVVTVSGPSQGVVIRRKERVFGIWVNTESRIFIDAPSYLVMGSNRPLAEIADTAVRRQFATGLDQLVVSQLAGGSVSPVAQNDFFRGGLIRLKTREGLYSQDENAITFLTPNLFRAEIPIPANAPIGTYEIDAKLFADGVVIARDRSAFEIVKVGFEQFVAVVAHDHGALYGLATAGMALLIGFFASVVFRRD